MDAIEVGGSLWPRPAHGRSEALLDDAHQSTDVSSIGGYSASQWDELVGTFQDALYDHTATLGADLWGSPRLSHFSLHRGERIIGAAQALILRPPGFSSGPGIAHAKFAPLWRQKGREADIRDLRATLGAMAETYARGQGLHLTIAPQADPDTREIVCRELLDLGFKQRSTQICSRRYVVDCGLDEDEQRASLAQKWRYNLKKSEANRLSVHIANDADGLQAFMDLHREMRQRKNFQDYTWVERFPRLLEQLPVQYRPTVVLACHEGTPAAGAVIGRIGNTATYLFGGTDARALGLRAGYALQWWITRWLSQEGVRWYDLDSDSDDHGLAQFKSGLVGKRGHIVEMPGEFDLCFSGASKAVAVGLQALRNARNSTRTGANALRKLCRL